MTDIHWFGFMIMDTVLHIGRHSVFFVAAQVFNRRFADGTHAWGFGVIQIGHRHLFHIGHGGVSLLFTGQTR